MVGNVTKQDCIDGVINHLNEPPLKELPSLKRLFETGEVYGCVMKINLGDKTETYVGFDMEVPSKAMTQEDYFAKGQDLLLEMVENCMITDDYGGHC